MRRYWKSRHPRIGDEARAGCTIQIHVLNARESNLMLAADEAHNRTGNTAVDEVLRRRGAKLR
jgi:hypothetical protein